MSTTVLHGPEALERAAAAGPLWLTPELLARLSDRWADAHPIPKGHTAAITLPALLHWAEREAPLDVIREVASYQDAAVEVARRTVAGYTPAHGGRRLRSVLQALAESRMVSHIIAVGVVDPHHRPADFMKELMLARRLLSAASEVRGKPFPDCPDTRNDRCCSGLCPAYTAAVDAVDWLEGLPHAMPPRS